MSNEKLLDKQIVEFIQTVVDEIKNKKQIKLNSVIKDGIFDVLERKCTVIYYLLENEINRGFHIKRLVNERVEDFVYINTDNTVEQQVFTAAHELGHVYNVYSSVCKKAIENGIELDVNNQDYEEKVTDRFAAEFIMPENLFKNISDEFAKELHIYSDTSLLVFLRLMAKLMDYFMAPFDAIRKRLYEIDFIDRTTNKFFSENKNDLIKIINLFKKDDNSVFNSKTKVMTISGLREFLDKAMNIPETDKNLIKKIKSDFKLEDVSSINIENEKIKLTDTIKLKK